MSSQWAAVPCTLRSVWEQVGERLRNALDLPTKTDLQHLSTRLDEIDARLAALLEARAEARAEAARVAASTASSAQGSGPPNGTPAPRAKTTAEKRVRKR